MNKIERDFIAHHGIPASSIEDLSGLPRTEWRQRMRSTNALVSIAGAPCRAFGHRLRVSGGQCAQCNPHSLGYTRRHRSPGFVYVAFSTELACRKVGTAVDPRARIELLSREKYGGAVDWVLEASFQTDRAGDVETRAQRALKRFRQDGSYRKEGKSINAKELFCADLQQVRKAIRKALRDIGRE
ncbi:GIY-YIG nuclease family protein [Thioalkalivibrio sp. XN279]|uniref:GIY-YIG nuclease family protein n=1 Tax=Thioalkalivibrio sp. XN279 TaxID=2714953 RepID=UPI00140CE3D7|nr:GIY-YIG nuclease family protein [Thioalkalivibrio sp. XN279]NHA14603.1 GIY-YIG nuclease family protein [Thioalkalivibrio sp. XN279]